MSNSPFLRVSDFLSTRRRRGISLFRDWIEPGPDLSVIDVGGGTGAATELFTKGCGQVVILEPEFRKLEYARRRRNGMKLVEGVAENIPLSDEQFDMALAMASFHHLRDHDKALTEMKRVLKPGGRIMIFEFDPTTPQGKLSRFFENDVLRHGCTFHPPAELKSEVEGHGFREISIRPAPLGYVLTAKK